MDPTRKWLRAEKAPSARSSASPPTIRSHACTSTLKRKKSTIPASKWLAKAFWITYKREASPSKRLNTRCSCIWTEDDTLRLRRTKRRPNRRAPSRPGTTLSKQCSFAAHTHTRHTLFPTHINTLNYTIDILFPFPLDTSWSFYMLNKSPEPI